MSWLKVGLPIVVVAIPLVWLYLVRVAARLPDEDFVGGHETIEEARRNLGRMSAGERVALVAFLTAALLWIFRKDIDLGAFTIPGWSRWVGLDWSDLLGRPLATLPAPFPKLLADTGDSVVAMGVGVILLLVPVQRQPLRFALGLREARGVAWSMLALLGGGFAMAYGIQSSGLSHSIANLVKGVGQLHPFVATLLVVFVAVILTEVASNVATASIILPLLAASGASLGGHPASLMFAATLAASFGFMLPAGTPPNAIAFASGYITVPQMARCGLVVDLTGGLLITVVCYYLVPWALGLP